MPTFVFLLIIKDYSDDGSDSVAVKKEQSFTKAAPMVGSQLLV